MEPEIGNNSPAYRYISRRSRDYNMHVRQKAENQIESLPTEIGRYGFSDTLHTSPCHHPDTSRTYATTARVTVRELRDA